MKRWSMVRPGPMLALGAVLLILGGCAHYQPRPLPEGPDLAERLPTVDWDKVAAPVPGLGKTRFDPADGLDREELVILAISHNPGLATQRARLGLAQAQLFAAGLLPDPQLALGVEQATGHSANSVPGYSLGLSEDLRALILHQSVKKAADNHQQQVNLELLWQEWQVAERARELFISLRSVRQRESRLRALRQMTRQRYQAEQGGLRKNMVSQSVVAADRSTLADIDDRLAELMVEQSRQSAELNQLLGLRPGVPVRLVGDARATLPDTQTISQAVNEIGQRRPDLIALRYGYQNQEQQVSQAILAQFPAISVGLDAARDTGNTRTLGLNVSLNLPLFGGQRGPIAVQRAKRIVLRSDYQQRLDQAVSDSLQIESVARQQQARLAALQRRAPELKAEAAAASAAVSKGLLDQRSADDRRAQWIHWQLRMIEAESDLATSATMLATVVGMPLQSLIP